MEVFPALSTRIRVKNDKYFLQDGSSGSPKDYAGGQDYADEDYSHGNNYMVTGREKFKNAGHDYADASHAKMDSGEDYSHHNNYVIVGREKFDHEKIASRDYSGLNHTQSNSPLVVQGTWQKDFSSTNLIKIGSDIC